MGIVYFIADLHLGHTNMALKRGFRNVEDHDNHIITQWNKVVTNKDSVWILGDITMEKSSSYALLDQLKGYKKVVLGNHDKSSNVRELLSHVNNVCGMIKYKNFILSHCPIHPKEIRRFKGNIHGHVHENTLSDKRYFNVSCEAINYTPISFNELQSRFIYSNTIFGKILNVLNHHYLSLYENNISK